LCKAWLINEQYRLVLAWGIG